MGFVCPNPAVLRPACKPKQRKLKITSGNKTISMPIKAKTTCTTRASSRPNLRRPHDELSMLEVGAAAMCFGIWP